MLVHTRADLHSSWSTTCRAAGLNLSNQLKMGWSREPWTSRIRAAIRQRYALLPYIYTLFREANTDGVPVMRPMW